jgi:enolase
VHAHNGVAIQEFSLVPAGASSFAEALRIGAETFHELRLLLEAKGLAAGVGDEGGFAPRLSTAEQGLDLLVSAIHRAGYEPGADAWLALDCAATELAESGGYRLIGDDLMSTDETIAYWADLCEHWPIRLLEDPLAEEDVLGWQRLTRRLSAGILIVGDDLFTTRTTRLAQGIELGLATGTLLKPGQVGTLTQTLDAARLAHQAGLAVIVAGRAGDTEDTTVADLAVACGAHAIKAGAPCRSERVAKYNELLRIEAALGSRAAFSGERLAPRGASPPTRERVAPK